MFKKILIANRGEIAVRIIWACKELGIISASVYSEVDKYALHSRLADESHSIGESLPSESYLNQNKIIELALEIKADAIHPGYGFLSENAAFIKKVEASGINFIGPSSRSVEMMGSKTAARELMKKNGVPIVPGTTEKIISIASAKKSANQIGYPILLKASAGGGGKGMKRVFAEDELEAAFSSAQREALKAFGDDSIYIEKLVENPKHIEVQIIADKFGNYCHLFERECSVQRRHQKVIEEAPSSFVDDETRNRITTAAINAAKACGYYNAGTIEFLMDKNKNFFFLEMNTRLQVEHPITEFITGIDLVKEQIKIASGGQLSFKQDDLRILGHAIECRVYAEDPENNFLPITGTVEYHRLPSGPNIRIDRGIETSSEVSRFYDPLLSKISVMEKHREEAIKRMDIALNDYLIAGIKTNIAFLKRILRNEKFMSGEYSINLIEEDFLSGETGNEDPFINEGLEEVAAIFAAYLKQLPQNHVPSKKVHGTNRWAGLQYE
ncbi:MAG: acetyl-CoA carboxylase biotin carboxylase subunit [Ignavibacteriaceae bacterium]